MFDYKKDKWVWSGPNGFRFLRIPLRRNLDQLVKQWHQNLRSKLGREPTDEEENIAWNEQMELWRLEDKARHA